MFSGLRVSKFENNLYLCEMEFIKSPNTHLLKAKVFAANFIDVSENVIEFANGI